MALFPLLGGAILASLFLDTKKYGYGNVYDVRRQFARLSPHFPEMLKVEWKESNGDETYILEKTRAYLCTRNADNVPYSDNIMTFVILHELAHAMSRSHGHSAEWNEIFQSLLDRAIEVGLYDPALMSAQKYCRYDL